MPFLKRTHISEQEAQKLSNIRKVINWEKKKDQ